MLRVTIYGWAIPEDRLRGPGSGTFVDLVYFVDDSISVGDILDVIRSNGFKFIPVRYPASHPLAGQVMADKVTIDEMTIGTEEIDPEDYPDDFDLNYQRRELQSHGLMGARF
jgi:hypothetical protein